MDVNLIWTFHATLLNFTQATLTYVNTRSITIGGISTPLLSHEVYQTYDERTF